jgi:S-adenosylmethionine:tRNA-ribosyltransferase-isomerase (queuine synthetase)
MWNFVGTITVREIQSVWRLTSSSTAFSSSNSVLISMGFNMRLLVEHLTSHLLSYDMAMSGVTVLQITQYFPW